MLIETGHSLSKNGERASEEWNIVSLVVGERSELATLELFRDSPESGACNCTHAKGETKKRRITKSAVTSTHGGFRHSKLDTVADSANRIFQCEGVVHVQGLPTARHLKPSARQVKSQ